jgi:hypothetical protein
LNFELRIQRDSVGHVTGTILNASAILVGGIIGLTTTKQISEPNQRLIKTVLGALIVYVGLSMTWDGLNGSLLHCLKQLTIVILALTLGRIAGRVLHLQKSLNRLGQIAKRKFTNATPGNENQNRASDPLAKTNRQPHPSANSRSQRQFWGQSFVGRAAWASSKKTALPGTAWSLRKDAESQAASVSKKLTAVVRTMGARHSAASSRSPRWSKSARW